MKCIICGNETGFFSDRIKTDNGYICSECAKYLPQNVTIDNLSITALNRIINWNHQYLKSYQKHFMETSCYGDLHIDDVHGLFAIYPGKYKRIPFNCSDIFNILLVKDYSFAMKTSGVSNQNKAYGTAEFACELNNLGISFKKVIKPKIVCHTEEVDSEHYRVVEPSDLSLMRTTFMQAINNAAYKYNQKFREDIASKEALDVFRAKSLFMVGDNYTKEEIAMQKRRLLKAFKCVDDNETYIFTIKNAYNVLLGNMEEE